MFGKLQKIWIERWLYPVMERWKGNRIRAMERDLLETVRGGAAQLQWDRLRELLLDCAAHVPAYRNLDPSLIQADPEAALLTALPLKKAEFQQNGEAHLSGAVPASDRIPNCTGGSTGQPVRFYMTRNQVESYEAARWRGLSWYGITQGNRCAMVWGNPVELSAREQLRHRLRERLLKNRVVLPAYDLTRDRLRAHIRFLNRYRPEYLYGYTNMLTAFAQGMAQEGLTLSFTLKAVVSTSETLEPWPHELLARVFRCPVVNEYGARDAGILAYSCPEYGRFHLTQENCAVEILDPRTLEPLPAGERGLIAVTDLHNRVQPWLRYLLGDVGSLGREDALLVRPDGGLVHGNAVGQLLRTMNGILAFQFRQASVTEGLLLLVMAPGFQPDQKEITEKLRRVLPDLHLTIRTVNAFRPPPPASSATPSGRFPSDTRYPGSKKQPRLLGRSCFA